MNGGFHGFAKIKALNERFMWGKFSHKFIRFNEFLYKSFRVCNARDYFPHLLKSCFEKCMQNNLLEKGYYLYLEQIQSKIHLLH